jgi:cytochrome c peroxidase
LFYEKALSIDSSTSCASCHNQELAFADEVTISPGVDGRFAARNAPTLTNVGYNPTLLFDGFLKTLEMQALVPIEEHNEMATNIVDVSQRLQKDSWYVKMCRKAYKQEPNPYCITRALGAFQRTLISDNSKYDQFRRGKAKLTVAEERGADLFFNKLYCSQCHGGFNFTSFEVANNGLYTNYADSGRMRVTKKELDRALFKIPTLRNIELTAPYMHDGSVVDLSAVIRHYASGGLNHPSKSPIIKPFEITEQEEEDLLRFLKTLTDESFIGNKKFSEPNRTKSR